MSPVVISPDSTAGAFLWHLARQADQQVIWIPFTTMFDRGTKGEKEHAGSHTSNTTPASLTIV